MASVFRALPAKAEETYRNPATGRTRGLRYWVTKKGRHAVAMDHSCLEQPFPDAWAFRDVREARDKWRELRRALACQGYDRTN